jgi:hypothetical protein
MNDSLFIYVNPKAIDFLDAERATQRSLRWYRVENQPMVTREFHCVESYLSPGVKNSARYTYPVTALLC